MSELTAGAHHKITTCHVGLLLPHHDLQSPVVTSAPGNLIGIVSAQFSEASMFWNDTPALLDEPEVTKFVRACAMEKRFPRLPNVSERLMANERASAMKCEAFTWALGDAWNKHYELGKGGVARAGTVIWEDPANPSTDPDIPYNISFYIIDRATLRPYFYEFWDSGVEVFIPPYSTHVYLMMQ